MSKINIEQLIRDRFPENEFAVMREVGSSSGFARRRADFVLMNLWPSRGNAITGIEVKSYRSDWKKELSTPQKADDIFGYCDFWYLVTTADGVANEDEIPENWGWLHVKGDKLVLKKKSPKLSPKPLTKGFVSCMLRRAVAKEGYIHKSEIQETIEREKVAALTSANHINTELKSELDSLKAIHLKFQQMTGVDLNSFTGYRWSANSGTHQALVFKALVNKVTKASDLHSQLLRVSEVVEKLGKELPESISELERIKREFAGDNQVEED